LPSLFWEPYARHARNLGLDQLYLILSFDCDTPEDIQAADEIHQWLKARGCNGVFAVPGAQLKEGAATYRKMAAEGVKFINHGAAPHTEWRDGRYWSITFYDRMTPAEVEADIRLGHRIMTDVLGVAPKGFRAPHFGHYQQPEQLQHIYRILESLDYEYTTTTVPRFLISHGPAYRVGKLHEIPISGTYSSPLKILDSWTNLQSPYTPEITDAYSKAFISSVKQLLRAKIPGLINYYVDPAHVAKSPFFYASLNYCLEAGIPFLTYSKFVDMI